MYPNLNAVGARVSEQCLAMATLPLFAAANAFHIFIPFKLVVIPDGCI